MRGPPCAGLGRRRQAALAAGLHSVDPLVAAATSCTVALAPAAEAEDDRDDQRPAQGRGREGRDRRSAAPEGRPLRGASQMARGGTFRPRAAPLVGPGPRGRAEPRDGAAARTDRLPDDAGEPRPTGANLLVGGGTLDGVGAARDCSGLTYFTINFAGAGD